MRCLRKKMSQVFSLTHRYKRTLQAMAVGTFVIYMTLVLYQNVYGYSSGGNSVQELQYNSVDSQTAQDVISKRDSSANSANGNKNNVIDSASPSVVGQSAVRSRAGLPHISSYPTRFDKSYYDYQMGQLSVTGTPKPPTTELDDLLISVKTTKGYHDTRLEMIIKTWYQLAKEQTWFFTDTDDQHYQKMTNGHMVNTNCSQGHFRKALCCKMGREFEFFLDSAKKWWCHFDDDNYVNVPRLVRLLDEYSPTQDWYLGKPSISSPLEIFLDNTKSSTEVNKKVTFWFATGGAGFCISRALALKMLPIAGSGKFVAIGDKIRFPDDVTMGFIIEHILNVPLTVVDAFHSHLEPMEFIRPETFHDQVSFSYARMKNEWNVVKVDGFDLKTDPKRIYSLHCHLYPFFSICPKTIKRR
ncbi:fringe glycosyltransferase [Toxorhynchites rutilus septentrionalis]|uniref:fringe glycosyltransferase n=1 Tax=Toxorhynchites rutilus septentrionalis TaxID=329112 RepID=UPI002478F24E|nr:fringe glycosyltransferase [Toxorhynchites rutilus septentrionalis]